MFTVRVAARVHRNGCDAFVAQLKKEEREVPEAFPGCERFSVFVDPVEPTNVLLYEEWRSRESFDTYRSSDYFAASAGVLFPLIDGAPDSAYFEAELVGP